MTYTKCNCFTMTFGISNFNEKNMQFLHNYERLDLKNHTPHMGLFVLTHFHVFSKPLETTFYISNKIRIFQAIGNNILHF